MSELIGILSFDEPTGQSVTVTKGILNMLVALLGYGLSIHFITSTEIKTHLLWNLTFRSQWAIRPTNNVSSTLLFYLHLRYEKQESKKTVKEWFR